MDWLQEIEERWAKAAPGPWAAMTETRLAYDAWLKENRARADAHDAAPDDIARLIAEVKRLRDRLGMLYARGV